MNFFVLEYFIEPRNRVYWGFLLSSFLIAIVYVYCKKDITLKSLFSLKIWLHPSAKLDYIYFVISYFIKIFMIFPILISAKTVALSVNSFLMEVFGFYHSNSLSYMTIMILFTITLFIVNDFSRYWVHRFFHTIPLLWDFHKVHHSAKVLTPITFYRVHPMENIIFGLRYSIIIGFVTGVFIYFFGAMLNIYDILGVNIIVFIFSLLGSNLRHSHVKLSYFSWCEKCFISPYMHQIHHSKNHLYKNYGSYLSIWDRLFKTLIISKDVHNIKLGLGKKEMINYNSLLKLLYTPFFLCFKRIKMYYIKVIGAVLATLIVSGCSNNNPAVIKEKLLKEKLEKEQLGQMLFFDTNLSKNRTQSCATCHNPQTAFTDNRDNGVNKMASMGDNGKSIGTRQALSAAYAKFSPKFHYDKESGEFVGGQFWDGRANTLANQAGAPPLNPGEMGMPSKKAVVNRLKENKFYVEKFKKLYGNDIFKADEKAFTAMTKVIESFEMSKKFAPFNSKYDRFLQGKYELTPLEDLGKAIFFSNNNTSCSNCHMLRGEDRPKETFTNYRFFNIGVPINDALRAKNGDTSIDKGLLDNPAVNDKKQIGKFKVPSLRNVAVTAPYMHNGVFKNLKTVIEFYDKYNNPNRKINPETLNPWKKAEVPQTIAMDKLKAKKLNDRKIKALVAFLKLLTDKRYEPLLKKMENKK